MPRRDCLDDPTKDLLEFQENSSVSYPNLKIKTIFSDEEVMNSKLCALILFGLALALVAYGMYDVLAPAKPSEGTNGQVVSRQMRGIGLVLLGFFSFKIAKVCYFSR